MRFRNSLTWAVAALVATAACAHQPPPSSPAPPALPAPPARPADPARSSTAAVQSLQRDIDAVLQASPLSHSYWGVLARSLKTGETLYAVNANKLMMPASNMKIVTLAAAAEALGWDYTF
jgi:D-alanyl-D-alanine carboxypeptidase/D-alanyl-D-alanine-endopeptidase (penicillin-binding protein 4)